MKESRYIGMICLTCSETVPRNETLNEDKTLNQPVTAPLQKHAVVGRTGQSFILLQLVIILVQLVLSQVSLFNTVV